MATTYSQDDAEGVDSIVSMSVFQLVSWLWPVDSKPNLGREISHTGDLEVSL